MRDILQYRQIYSRTENITKWTIYQLYIRGDHTCERVKQGLGVYTELFVNDRMIAPHYMIYKYYLESDYLGRFLRNNGINWSNVGIS